MNKLAMFVVMFAAGCGGKKSENNSEATGAKKPTDTTTCPMPAAKGAEKTRFAVGSIPVARIEGLYHGAKCHDTFVPNDVVKLEGESFRLVAEGTFQGHCKDEPENKRTYEAVKAAKVIVEVGQLAGMDLGELGLGKPVVLDSKTPDKHVSVTARVADRCGTTLEGVGDATWELGAGCENVAKLLPWDVLTGKPEPTSPEMRIVAVGSGSCTVSATMFGAKGDVPVTVK